MADDEKETKTWEYRIYIPWEGDAPTEPGVYELFNAIELHTPECTCEKCRERYGEDEE